MQLETVKMSAIVPDENNPREDFGDIEALADTFDLNPINPGEPVNPPVVVRDGNICRIVDGERRYRAMRHLGLEECHAIVCEDMDEAAVMVAMVATDDKRQLSDAERSRGVQQMLILGVDTVQVECAAKLKPGQGAAVRRSMERAEAKAAQMSIAQLLAIEECAAEGATDEELQEIVDAPAGRWPAHASRARRAAKRRIVDGQLRSAAIAHGIDAEDYDGYYPHIDGWEIASSVRSADLLEEQLDGIAGDVDVRVVLPGKCGDATAFIMVPEGTAEEEEPSEEEQLADEYHALISAARNARRSWYAHCLEAIPGTTMRRQLTPIVDAYLMPQGGWRAERFLENVDVELGDMAAPAELRGIIGVECWEERAGDIDCYGMANVFAGSRLGTEADLACLEGYTEFVDLMKMDGYEPQGEDRELYSLAKATIIELKESLAAEAEAEGADGDDAE